MSFRLKTILGITLIQGVILLLLGVGGLSYLEQTSHRQLQLRAEATAQLLATTAREAVIAQDLATLAAFTSQLSHHPDLLSVRIRTPSGQVLSESPPRPGGHTPGTRPQPVESSALVTAGGMLFGRVEVAMDSHPLAATLEQVTGRMAALAAGGILLTTLLSLLLGNYLLRHLERLNQATRRLAAGEVGYQIPIDSHDELALSAAAFNRMSRQLALVHEDLRGEEERLRAILDTVLEGIITTDQEGRIEAFNPAAERVFGYHAGEVLGRNVSLLMPSPHRERHDGYLKAYLASGRPRVMGTIREETGQRKDGRTFPLELAVSDVRVRGRVLFTGVVRDLTERKRVERMKSEFVSTVSHELRTPLTALQGSLGLVLGGAAGPLPDKAAHLLSLADRNCKRLALLINDLLDMERIESGRMTFSRQPVDLVQLVQYALESNQAYARLFQVTLRLADPPPGSLLVQVDRNRLLQVLANLLSNAAKFSPAGGEVGVTVRANRPAGRAEVAVQDHGPGIPESFRERVFHKFAQADASDSRQVGGSGLGLAITRAIVERLGGGITFESGSGGTTFHFWLPLHSPHPAADKRGDAPPLTPADAAPGE